MLFLWHDFILTWISREWKARAGNGRAMIHSRRKFKRYLFSPLYFQRPISHDRAMAWGYHGAGLRNGSSEKERRSNAFVWIGGLLGRRIRDHSICTGVFKIRESYHSKGDWEYLVRNVTWKSIMYTRSHNRRVYQDGLAVKGRKGEGKPKEAPVEGTSAREPTWQTMR